MSLLERWRAVAAMPPGAVAVVLSKALEVALSLLLMVLLARTLGATGTGAYAFVAALVAALSVPARVGLSQLVMRETARAQVHADWSLIRGLWRWAGMSVGAISMAVVAGLGVALGTQWISDPAIRAVMRWGLVLLPIVSLVGIRAAALRGLGHPLAAIVPEQVVSPAALLALLAMATLLSRKDFSPATAMMLTAVAAVLAFGFGNVLLRRYRPAELMQVKPRYQRRAWIAAAWPMALSQGFDQINRYADLLLLGAFRETSDVAIYRIAAQGSLLVGLALTVLTILVAPMIARLHASKALDDLRALTRSTARQALALACLATLGFIIVGKLLLEVVFGADFVAAFWPLLILACGQIVSAGFGVMGTLLNMTGNERSMTLATGTAALLNVLLNLALIPYWGAVGAAVATMLSTIAWNVALWRAVRSSLGPKFSVLG